MAIQTSLDGGVERPTAYERIGGELLGDSGAEAGRFISKFSSMSGVVRSARKSIAKTLTDEDALAGMSGINDLLHDVVNPCSCSD